MLRRVNFYSVCFAFGVSGLLILAGSRYTDNTNLQASIESRRHSRNFLRIEDGDDNYMQPVPTNAYDGSPNINKLIENERSKLKQELLQFNFSYSGPRKLENLLMEASGQPQRSLIISTWRSGTTFLGEILNAVPGNFYHYEPLLSYGIMQIRGLPDSTKALKTLKKMFHCKFDNLDDYFEYGKDNLHQFSHNTRLWDHCKHKRNLCFDARFTEKFCKLFPFQSMKVVRLRLHLVEDLITDDKLNVKVVLLIRDPRGVMQSRQHRDFCQPSPDCWNPELLCADMISDYVAAAKLLKKYPQRLMVLRYEELALNPRETAHQVLKFLGLGMTPAINQFLNTHTNKEAGSVSSTYRISREVPFRWKKLVNFDYVENIQMACKEAMNLWGYQMAYNASHMMSKEFNPLKKYVVEI